MFLRIDQKTFNKAVKENILVVGPTDASDAFKSIKLEASENELKLFTQSRIMRLVTRVPAEVAEPGMVVVQAELLYRLISKYDDGFIELKLMKNGVLRVSYNGSVYGLPTAMDPQFMSFMEPMHHDWVALEPASLLDMLNRTTYLCNKDASTYRSVVKMEPHPKGLVCTATDGFRLSTLVRQGSTPQPFCLTGTTCSVLMKLLTKAETLAWEVGASELAVRVDNKVLYSHYSAVKYPNYQQIFPTGTCHSVRLDRGVLSQVLSRMVLVDDTVRVTLDKHQMKIAANSELANGTEEVPYVSSEIEKPGLLIGLNPTYLSEALKYTDDAVVTLEFRDRNTVVVMRGGPDHLQLIVPKEV